MEGDLTRSQKDDVERYSLASLRADAVAVKDPVLQAEAFRDVRRKEFGRWWTHRLDEIKDNPDNVVSFLAWRLPARLTMSVVRAGRRLWAAYRADRAAGGGLRNAFRNWKGLRSAAGSVWRGMNRPTERDKERAVRRRDEADKKLTAAERKQAEAAKKLELPDLRAAAAKRRDEIGKSRASLKHLSPPSDIGRPPVSARSSERQGRPAQRADGGGSRSRSSSASSVSSNGPESSGWRPSAAREVSVRGSRGADHGRGSGRAGDPPLVTRSPGTARGSAPAPR